MNIRVFGFYDGSKAKCLGGHTKITTFSLKSYLITKLRSRLALPGSFKNSSVPSFGMMQKEPSDLRPVNSVGNLGWSASKHVLSCNVTMSHKAVISTNVMPQNRNDTVGIVICTKDIWITFTHAKQARNEHCTFYCSTKRYVISIYGITLVIKFYHKL